MLLSVFIFLFSFSFYLILLFSLSSSKHFRSRYLTFCVSIFHFIFHFIFIFYISLAFFVSSPFLSLSLSLSVYLHLFFYIFFLITNTQIWRKKEYNFSLLKVSLYFPPFAINLLLLISLSHFFGSAHSTNLCHYILVVYELILSKSFNWNEQIFLRLCFFEYLLIISIIIIHFFFHFN